MDDQARVDQLVGLLTAVSGRYLELSPAAHLAVMEALDLYLDCAVAPASPDHQWGAGPVSDLLHRAVTVAYDLAAAPHSLDSQLRHRAAQRHLEIASSVQ